MDTSKLPPFLRRRTTPIEPPISAASEGVTSLSDATGAHHRILTAEGLIQLADEVWRLGKRAERLSRSSGETVAGGLVDSAERLKAVLNDLGLTFEDHTGKPYGHEDRLDVAQVDGEVSESSSLWINQTVKPTVLFDGRVIRHGQVILSADHPAEREA